MKNTLFALAILAASSSQLVAQRSASAPTLTGTIIVHVEAPPIAPEHPKIAERDIVL